MRSREGTSMVVVLVWAAALFAQGANGSELTATGRLVSTGDMSLVLKTDDGREQGPFIITTTTQLPSGIAAGNRVTVFYHPVGDREVADRIVPAAAPGQPAPPQTRPTSGRPAADQPTVARGPRAAATACEALAPQDTAEPPASWSPACWS